jgi:hypothetical protein
VGAQWRSGVVRRCLAASHPRKSSCWTRCRAWPILARRPLPCFLKRLRQGIGITSGDGYSQSFRAAWLQVSLLPSYKTVADELEQLKSQGRTVGYWQSDLVAGLAFPIIYKYITTGAYKGAFNEAEFGKLYDEVESYVSGTEEGVRVFLDLTNLVTNLSPIVLDESHRIMQIDKDTLRRLLSRAYRTDVPITARSQFFTTLTGWKPAGPRQEIVEMTAKADWTRNSDVRLFFIDKKSFSF